MLPRVVFIQRKPGDAQLDPVPAVQRSLPLRPTAAYFWLYSACVTGPEDPRIGEAIELCLKAGVTPYGWFSPYGWKWSDSPERAAFGDAMLLRNRDGEPFGEGGQVCPMQPAVRALEADLLGALAKRWPQLAGLCFEEPGVPDGLWCYCEHCRREVGCQGIDLTDPDERFWRVASASTQGLLQMRRALPKTWALSVTGTCGRNPDWYQGRMWGVWLERGWIGRAFLMNYTPSAAVYQERLATALAAFRPERIVPTVRTANGTPQGRLAAQVAREQMAISEAMGTGWGLFTPSFMAAEDVDGLLAEG